MNSDLPAKISAMTEGGRQLGLIKKQLAQFTQVGTSFEAIEAEAQRLIKAAGAKPSFSTVPGYSWATCIMKNDEGDVVTIDVGLIYQGYHLDTTITFVVGQSNSQKSHFLEVGRRSLNKAINKARAGNTVFDISAAMQRVVEAEGYSCVYQLCGHGISQELHENPDIPCVAQRHDKKKKLVEGQTVAIEIMYAQGDAALKVDPDKWTYRTIDGSLTGMFEETVLITKQGPVVLTHSP